MTESRSDPGHLDNNTCREEKHISGLLKHFTEYSIEIDMESSPPQLSFDITTWKTTFEAELCGADHKNYIYVRRTDQESLDNYHNICCVVRKYFGGVCYSTLPESDIVPGRYAVLKTQNQFHRVLILEKKDYGLVHCFRIDEGTCVIGSYNHMYPLPMELLFMACTAIRCRLKGLDLFNDLPHMELGIRLVKMAETANRQGPYKVEVLGICDGGVPYITMQRNGTYLLNEIQKYIPTLCAPLRPMKEDFFHAEVLYASEKGQIWFRSLADGAIFDRILTMLNLLHLEILNERFSSQSQSSSEEGSSSSECSTLSSSSSSSGRIHVRVSPNGVNISPKLTPQEEWKAEYFDSKKGIYIAKYRNRYYRAKITRVLNKEKVEIEFIDYGNRQKIWRSEMIPAFVLDENLALIPAQCVTAWFRGFHRIHVPTLWKFIDGKPVHVTITDPENPDEDTRVPMEIFLGESYLSLNQTWLTASPEHLKFCRIKECYEDNWWIEEEYNEPEYDPPERIFLPFRVPPPFREQRFFSNEDIMERCCGRTHTLSERRYLRATECYYY